LKNSFNLTSFPGLSLEPSDKTPIPHRTTAKTGNITSKTGTGTYQYTSPKPHALSGITGNEGSIPGADCNIAYTSENQIKTIAQGLDSMIFKYGNSDNRNKSIRYYNNQAVKTVYYSGIYEEAITGTTIRKMHYIYAGDGLIISLKTNRQSKDIFPLCHSRK
jgi:hypothetical protein